MLLFYIVAIEKDCYCGNCAYLKQFLHLMALRCILSCPQIQGTFSGLFTINLLIGVII